jgi:transcriptional regulator with XRE-family HTH domain
MDTPLKRLRKRQKKTLQEVADAIGTDTGNLSRIEQGKQRSLDLAEKLVEFYGSGTITEAEILYPERYPLPKGKRKVAANVPESARG